MEGVAFVGFIMIVVGVPILAVVGIAAYSRWLQHRKLQLLLEERKLLIEKGVTDLPPLALPKLSRRTDRLRNLKGGIVLLFVAGAFAIAPFGGPQSENEGLAVILAAVGLALLVIHALTGYYERRDRGEQELSGQEGASVIEVDVEE